MSPCLSASHHTKSASGYPLALFTGIDHSRFERADDFIHVFDAILITPCMEFTDDACHGGRVREVRGADLYGLRTRHHEFDDVLAGHDAAQPADGDTDGFRDLPDHTKSHGLDRRAGEAAGDVAEDRGSRSGIDSDAEEGIDERDGISAGRFDGFGDGDYVRDIRREFHDDRKICRILYGSGDRGCLLGVSAEGCAADFDIRAGNIDFERRDAGDGEEFRAFGVFFDGFADHVRDVGAAEFLHFRKVVFEEVRRARIFQPDAVQHAGGGFRDAGTVIASPWRRRKALAGDGADFLHIDELGKLKTEADGAGGTDHWACHRDAEEIHS